MLNLSSCNVNYFVVTITVMVVLISVPPDILDYPTSTDMIVREGSNVNLHCVAKGSPEPSITWKREGGESIRLITGEEGKPQ